MIETLSPSHFRGPLAPPKSAGKSPIFRAKIAAGEESVRCYVKPTPDTIHCPSAGEAVENMELAAEILGYVLARNSGFSVPDMAGVILLTVDQLPGDLLPKLEQISPDGLQQDYLCWFSKDMAYPSLLQQTAGDSLPEEMLDLRLRSLVGRMLRNPESPRVVAFDDWLANSDRNLGNLLGSAESLLLIDHGRILAYPNWTPGRLGTAPGPVSNKIEALMDQYSPGWSKNLPTKSARMLAYRSFELKFNSGGADAAVSSLSSLLSPDDAAAVVRFLGSRLNPERYAKSMELLA